MTDISPKEGRWIARPKRPRWIAPTVLFIVFASQAPSWFNTFFSASRHSPIVLYVFTVILATLLVVAVALMVKNAIRRRLRPQDYALVDGSFGEQFLVEVTIGTGKAKFGTDRGVLWFSDGLMGFSGAATSFVLSADDIELQYNVGLQRGAKKRDNALRVDAVILKGAPTPGYFVIHPIDRAARTYRKRLHDFVREGAEHEGERVWPPLVPYDERKALEAGVTDAS